MDGEHSVQLRSRRPAQIRLEHKLISELRPASRRTRRHTRAKRELLKASHERHGDLGAVVATEDGEVLDGHERVEMYRELGRERAPVLVVPNRSPAAVTAARLILNRANGLGVSWSQPGLARDFQELLATDPTLIATTGFTMADVDHALFRAAKPPARTKLREALAPVTHVGDIWQAGRHRLLCGTARHPESYQRLLGPARVDMVLTTAPSEIGLESISKRQEGLLDGSEATDIEQQAVFEESLDAMSSLLRDGAVVDIFIDAGRLVFLANALRRGSFKQEAICVLDKNASGRGSLYRDQVEFVIVSKWGCAAHTNNIQRGRFKRNRSTLWSSAGTSPFDYLNVEGIGHDPRGKPTGVLADALLDTSNPGEIILDPFCGTGSTLLACERTGRVGRGLELDPKLVDTAIRRLEQEAGREAIHLETGMTFAELGRSRGAEAGQPDAQTSREDRS